MDNARNTDRTPYLGHGGGGAAMGDRGTDGKTPWYDKRSTPEILLEQIEREFRAQQEPEPERAPEQRAASVEQTASENQRDIAKLQSQIEELRVWVQERADGVSNLGTRVAKLEDAAREWHNRQHGINGDIYRDMHRYDDKLALASINGDNALDQRIQARAIELERRIDKVSGIADRNALSVSESLSNILTRLDRLEAQADKCARFRAIHPPVTEEDNDD